MMGLTLQNPTIIFQQGNAKQRQLFSQSCGENAIIRKKKLSTPKISCHIMTENLETSSITPQSRTFPLMINGCTGKMGRAVAEAAVSAGLQLVPLSFSSSEESGQIVQVGGTEIQIHGPIEREGILASVFDEYPNVIVVDYTVPGTVNANAELYCKIGVPFVMGTTGGDRQKLYKMVKDAKVYAVIPPKQDHNKIIFPYDFQEMKSVFHETKGQVRWIQSKWEEEHKAWLKYVEQELAKKRGKSIDATDQIENDLKSAEDELYVIPEHRKDTGFDGEDIV